MRKWINAEIKRGSRESEAHNISDGLGKPFFKSRIFNKSNKINKMHGTS